jgi:hypothetical protein
MTTPTTVSTDSKIGCLEAWIHPSRAAFTEVFRLELTCSKQTKAELWEMTSSR